MINIVNPPIWVARGNGSVLMCGSNSSFTLPAIADPVGIESRPELVLSYL